MQELVDAKARVVIVDRAMPLEAFDTNIVLFIRTDITRMEEVARAVTAAVAWTARTGAVLGGVINCAGVGVNEAVRTSRRTCYLFSPTRTPDRP